MTQGITLVVHDWGGMIGLAYATRHPERIARLVILNTGGLPAAGVEAVPLAAPDLPEHEGSAPGWSGAATPSPGSRRGSAASDGRCRKDLRDAYVAPYDSWANRIATLRFVQDIPLKPGDRPGRSWPRPPTAFHLLADVPMLIAWGLKDFVFDRHFLDEWTRRFQLAEVHRFEDGGHYILEDAGAEIIPRIQSFLAAHPVASVVG